MKPSALRALALETIKNRIEYIGVDKSELSEALSMCYNLLIWVDYYNYRIIGGDFYGHHER